MTKIFKLVRTAFLALLPFLFAAKFSLAGGVPTITWPNLVQAFPDLPTVAGSLLYWLELGLRLVPTLENYSLVNIAHELLSVLVPNRAVTPDGLHGHHYHEPVIDIPAAPGAVVI